MFVFTTILACVGAFIAAILTLKVMVTRVDHACRLAELVRETRRLRVFHRAATAPAECNRGGGGAAG